MQYSYHNLDGRAGEEMARSKQGSPWDGMLYVGNTSIR
jgi:hypothetical protein